MKEGLKRRPIKQFMAFVGKINEQRRADREFKRKVWEERSHPGSVDLHRGVIAQEPLSEINPHITIFIGPLVPAHMPGDRSSYHQISKESLDGGHLVADIVHFSGGTVPKAVLHEQRTAQVDYPHAEVVRPQ